MFECQRVQDNQRDIIATKANWRQEGTNWWYVMGWLRGKTTENQTAHDTRFNRHDSACVDRECRMSQWFQGDQITNRLMKRIKGEINIPTMLMPKMSHWECVHMTRGCRESVTCQKKESKHEQHKQRKDETRTKRNREITWMVVNQSKNYLANFVGVVMMTRPEVGNTANSSNQTKTPHRSVKENERRGEVYELIDLPILRTWARTFSGNGDIRGKNRDKRCFGSFCQEGMDFSRIHYRRLPMEVKKDGAALCKKAKEKWVAFKFWTVNSSRFNHFSP